MLSMAFGMDLFGRPAHGWQLTPLDERFPAAVREPRSKFKHLVCDALFNECWYSNEQLTWLSDAVRRVRGLDGRVRFEGRVSPERLAELYATCTAVFYAPVDEDFGMGPYEAFLAGKPVITTTDSGGPLDIVHDRRTGLVVDPQPAAIAQAASWLRAHEAEAASFGRAGKAIADEVTWDRAIARLLS